MAEPHDERTPDDVRYAMHETRARLSQTADQLGDALSARADAVRERVGAARDRVDIGELVQRHPWPAIGLALGLGMALSATGADRAAVRGTAQGARRASHAAREAMYRRRDRAEIARQLRVHERPRRSLVDRLTDGILDAIKVDSLVEHLKQASSELRHRKVSKNRLAGTDYWKG